MDSQRGPLTHEGEGDGYGQPARSSNAGRRGGWVWTANLVQQRRKARGKFRMDPGDDYFISAPRFWRTRVLVWLFCSMTCQLSRPIEIGQFFGMCQSLLCPSTVYQYEGNFPPVVIEESLKVLRIQTAVFWQNAFKSQRNILDVSPLRGAVL